MAKRKLLLFVELSVHHGKHVGEQESLLLDHLEKALDMIPREILARWEIREERQGGRRLRSGGML